MKKLVEGFDAFLQQAALAQTGHAEIFGENLKKKPKKSKKTSPKTKSKPQPK